MPLKELEAKNAKPKDRAYKLADSEGLFLLVQPNGSKLWRMKYRFGGKEKLLSFGAYPDLCARKTVFGQTVARPRQGSDGQQGGHDA